jgi:hypothetical protein
MAKKKKEKHEDFQDIEVSGDLTSEMIPEEAPVQPAEEEQKPSEKSEYGNHPKFSKFKGEKK